MVYSFAHIAGIGAAIAMKIEDVFTQKSPPLAFGRGCARKAASVTQCIATKIGNHTFRATGITAYLKNGGTLEKKGKSRVDGEPCQHASTRTTQLYDRRRDEMSLDEAERVVI